MSRFILITQNTGHCPPELLSDLAGATIVHLVGDSLDALEACVRAASPEAQIVRHRAAKLTALAAQHHADAQLHFLTPRSAPAPVPKPVEPATDDDATPTQIVIAADKLRVKRGRKLVLDNLQLVLRSSSICGLIGRNGAGKSTLLETISGMLPFRGLLAVGGQEVRAGDARLLQRLSFLADTQILPRWATVAQMCRWTAALHPQHDRKDARLRIERIGISMNARIETLSRGQIARVHLALVLANRASVLLLDEPTLGIDPPARSDFFNDLLNAKRAHNLSIIISSHELTELERVIDHVVVLDQRKITVEESTEHLRARYQARLIPRHEHSAAQQYQPKLTRNRSDDLDLYLYDASTPVPDDLGTVVPTPLADALNLVAFSEAK